MIDLDAITARVDGLGLFKRVGTVLQAGAAIEGKVPLPEGAAAFVVPVADTAAPAVSHDPVAQMETLGVGVLYCVKRAGDVTGASAGASLKALQDGLRAGLVGWTPPGCQGPLVLGGGRLMDLSAGIAWWMDEFTVAAAYIGQ